MDSTKNSLLHVNKDNKTGMLLSTCTTIEGYAIKEHMGAVVVSKSVSKCPCQALVSIFKKQSCTDVIQEAYDLALEELAEKAAKIGANALINLQLGANSFKFGFKSLDAVILSADAVVVDKIENFIPSGSLGALLSDYLNAKIDDAAEGDVPPDADIDVVDGIMYALCPECGARHRITDDEQFNKVYLGVNDIDNKHKGVQISCIKCGAKFTISVKE